MHHSTNIVVSVKINPYNNNNLMGNHSALGRVERERTSDRRCCVYTPIPPCCHALPLSKIGNQPSATYDFALFLHFILLWFFFFSLWLPYPSILRTLLLLALQNIIATDHLSLLFFLFLSILQPSACLCLNKRF